MDTLVSVYVRYEEEIELVAIGALSESADKSGRYVQVNIEHRINDELLSKIMQNDRMKKDILSRILLDFLIFQT